MQILSLHTPFLAGLLHVQRPRHSSDMYNVGVASRSEFREAANHRMIVATEPHNGKMHSVDSSVLHKGHTSPIMALYVNQDRLIASKLPVAPSKQRLGDTF